MKQLLYLFSFTCLFVCNTLDAFTQKNTSASIQNMKAQAQRVKILRDQWGIPHIYGKTDADAVFGLLYAQCEDDFKRVELNYIEKLGRLSEIKGAGSLYDDLLIKMIIDSGEAVKEYQNAPAWLKKLCIAFADGINYYLYTHPEVKPALLQHFEPWYPLLWTDGSIGAINTADLGTNDLKALYGGEGSVAVSNYKKNEDIHNETGVLTGSNGFAFSPKITSGGNAILYINPHVTFYFRPEVHMVSEEGLNAYGAVTWGQFFVYQGFNEHCGWMHTSCYVDAADTYIEKISNSQKGLFYQYENKQLPVTEKTFFVNVKNNGKIETRRFQTMYTHHGPVMAKRNEQYLSLRADNRITSGLIQCWQRTKAKNIQDFRKTLDLLGNISNNTVYADAQGHIAYWHGNRIPKRDPQYDWTKPVDGSIASTEWKGIHSIDETVHVIDPINGWLQNCNGTPFTVAGSESPQREGYPKYMAPDGENFRQLNAVRVLAKEKKYDINKVIQAGYDRSLTAFELLIPALVKAYDNSTKTGDIASQNFTDAITFLRNWDYKCDENSIATSLAVEWGQRILPNIFKTKIIEDEEADVVEKANYYATHADPMELLQAFKLTLLDLELRFGNWQKPWGEINRFQRISSDIDSKFDDKQPSIPVGYVSSTWGMLPSYTSRVFPNTTKRYGVNGNSFICAVEFGKKIKAKSLLAGGESGDPASPHFFDQSNMYRMGQFKDVLFYKEDVIQNTKESYHPGNRRKLP